MTRLVTERASQAAVTQRAGRAARQGPGVAYRLWEEAATAGLPRFDPPEIGEADLSALVLATAIWGVADPRTLRWLDPPPDAAVAEARTRLATLAALDGDGRPTAHGRAIAALPMPPRLAHMLLRGAERGLAGVAAAAAVLLSERGLGGNDPDLEVRLRRWRADRGPKAEAARGLARRWEKMANAVSSLTPVRAELVEAPSLSMKKDDPSTSSERTDWGPLSLSNALPTAIALAFPDRLARRRDASGETWASTGGRGFRLDPASSLARAEWLAVAETQGSAAGARILAAVPIEQASVEALFVDAIVNARTVAFDPATGGVQATRERRLGAIRLQSGPDPDADPAAIAAALLTGMREHGLELLPWSEAARALQVRAAFAGVPVDLTDDAWLLPLLAGKRRLDQIDPGALTDTLKALIGWEALKRIDRLAPPDFTSPAGSTHAIDYAAAAGPTVELRVQALFGLAAHPHVGQERIPLVLSLLSPAGRPIQTTRDLPAFWRGSWRDVAKEMRGRYPKHPWPDDPAAAAPTLRTKKADARAGGAR